MQIRKIQDPDRITGMAVCVEGAEAVHAGPLYDVGGHVLICERHLLALGRGIAATLASNHGIELDTSHYTGADIDGKPPLTWG